MRDVSITHIEWATSNLAQLQTFLADLFGWKFEPFGEGYFSYNPSAGVSVGLLHNPKAVPGGTPNVYVAVDSIDACLERAQALGGGVAVPKTVVAGMGGFAFVLAPDGNLIGLHELGR
jgi:predicted enzyme related to lactoylglutathione lyase